MRSLLALFAVALACCAPAPATEEPDQTAGGTTANVRLGEDMQLGSVRLRPLEVVEDSRCPSSVQCVHAGTVRLAVRAFSASGSRDSVLEFDEPKQLWPGLWVRLAAVCPHPRFPGAIDRGAYRFTFTVGETPPPPLDFICPRAP